MQRVLPFCASSQKKRRKMETTSEEKFAHLISLCVAQKSDGALSLSREGDCQTQTFISTEERNEEVADKKFCIYEKTYLQVELLFWPKKNTKVFSFCSLSSIWQKSCFGRTFIRFYPGILKAGKYFFSSAKILGKDS